ncbi:MAG: hypothetical protein ACJ74U_20210 [Jatrophihabitantaceae bacterium]
MSDGDDKNSVEEAAAQGPLPGAEEADEAARRGEDTSEVADPQERADEAGDETVPGGIAMGRG